MRIVPFLAVIAFATSAAAEEEGRSFFDDFNSLNKERWFKSDGWSNGPQQSCAWSAEESVVKNGILELTMRIRRKANLSYTCSELQSQQRYGYGVYEARIKGVAGSGLNSNIFTYTGPPLGSPRHDEVDIEMLGKSPGKVQLNYFVDGKGQHEKLIDLGFDQSKDFHSYAFDWEKDYIRWYVDGRLVHEARGTSLPIQPSKIFISLWSGSDQVNDWLGKFTFPETRPKFLVDWIGFTKAGEKCLFAQSITCKH